MARKSRKRSRNRKASQAKSKQRSGSASKQKSKDVLAKTVETKLDEVIESVAECCDVDLEGAVKTDRYEPADETVSEPSEEAAQEIVSGEPANEARITSEDIPASEETAADLDVSEASSSQVDLLDQSAVEDTDVPANAQVKIEYTDSSKGEADNSEAENAEVENAEHTEQPHEGTSPLEGEDTLPAPQSLDEVAMRVDANTNLLGEIAQQLAKLRDMHVAAGNAPAHDAGSCAIDSEIAFDQTNAEVDSVPSLSEVAESSTELDDLRYELQTLRQQLADSNQQNEELIEKARETAAAATADSMTWEQRKEIMMQQMEDDSFDAELFVSKLSIATETESAGQVDPVQFVNDLIEELDRCKEEIEERDDKIDELTGQLQQLRRQECEQDQFARSSSTSTLDADAMVREEREKLREMQQDWESRFRESEIAASLERARISRERRALSLRNAELEEQLIHFRRESEQSRKAGVSGSRRWLAKLGLHD